MVRGEVFRFCLSPLGLPDGKTCEVWAADAHAVLAHD